MLYAPLLQPDQRWWPVDGSKQSSQEDQAGLELPPQDRLQEQAVVSVGLSGVLQSQRFEQLVKHLAGTRPHHDFRTLQDTLQGLDLPWGG